MTSAPPVVLRPLNIGEIFDRAVTMYVKNFVVFSLMLLVVLVPIGIAQYAFQGPSEATQLQQVIQTFENPAAAAKAHPAPNPFPYSGPQLVGLLALTVLAIVLMPVATNAVAIGVAMLYAGKQPEFSTCFLQAMRSWGRLFGTIILFGLMFLAVYIGGIIALVLLFVIGGAFISGALPLAVICFIIGGLGFLALIVLLMLMVLAGYFAFFAVSIEGDGVTSAIGSGMRRVFSRTEFRRAILMALAFGALQLGVGSVAGMVGVVLILVLKMQIVQLVITTVINAVLSGFVTTLIAVYYYDVRIRQEGYDLEADLQRLGVAQALAPTQ